VNGDELEVLRRRFPKQSAICEFLIANGGEAERSKLGEFSQSALNSLVKKGIVMRTDEEVARVVYNSLSESVSGVGEFSLTEEQRAAVGDMVCSLRSGKFSTHLLHGITGSGKTEVYIGSIREVLQSGGDAIYLVPELALTPQTVVRIRRGLPLPPSGVVVWHSGLSDGERRDAWLAMSAGRAKVVIGARSAVFAPMKNLRLIVVDEEHETTYKQGDGPRYHGRDVAVYRAKLCNALCILGSATPSIESMANAMGAKYRLNELKKRIDGRSLPRVRIVDMRYEARANWIISSPLAQLIGERLGNGEQVILFLNKRGYASSIFCNDCDYVATCPHCSTALTYHRPQNSLRCHICDHCECLPNRCPRCGSDGILQSGFGTQKVVAAVNSIFPVARVERIDSDTMGTKLGFYNALERFGGGEVDILIGTQMIAKGLDFPNVSLIGIINVDGAMNFPDFRANERVFQSIVQVSGRAGRGDKPGLVVIQTRCASSELLSMAISNDFKRFFYAEMKLRCEFSYPPYARLIRLIFAARSEPRAVHLSRAFFDHLSAQISGEFEIRGPAPAAIEKVKDYFRHSIFCFVKNVPSALAKINNSMQHFEGIRDVRISIDVDPIDCT
jgi:primosomal protein N' (replication factor Y)